MKYKFELGEYAVGLHAMQGRWIPVLDQDGEEAARVMQWVDETQSHHWLRARLVMALLNQN